MPSIALNEENTPQNINWFVTVEGVLTDVYLIEYAIFNINGGVSSSVQIFPVSGWENVTNAPGRYETGSYYAYDNANSRGWTPENSLIIGHHRIVWRWKLRSDSPYKQDAEDFELTRPCPTIPVFTCGGNRNFPRLLHPIPTDIQSVLPNDTIQDDDYEEPVYEVLYDETYTIPGQWKWYSHTNLNMQRYGAEEEFDGYVLLRLCDLNSIGKQIKRGDRIVGYGSGSNRIGLDVYVVKLVYEGHYPVHGGPSLVKAFFKERR